VSEFEHEVYVCEVCPINCLCGRGRGDQNLDGGVT
jgi:hypothetical protein